MRGHHHVHVGPENLLFQSPHDIHRKPQRRGLPKVAIKRPHAHPERSRSGFAISIMMFERGSYVVRDEAFPCLGEWKEVQRLRGTRRMRASQLKIVRGDRVAFAQERGSPYRGSELANIAWP